MNSKETAKLLRTIDEIYYLRPDVIVELINGQLTTLNCKVKNLPYKDIRLLTLEAKLPTRTKKFLASACHGTLTYALQYYAYLLSSHSNSRFAGEKVILKNGVITTSSEILNDLLGPYAITTPETLISSLDINAPKWHYSAFHKITEPFEVAISVPINTSLYGRIKCPTNVLVGYQYLTIEPLKTTLNQ